MSGERSDVINGTPGGEEQEQSTAVSANTKNHNRGGGGEVDEEELEKEEDEEAAHFDKIVDAFLYYRRHAEAKLGKKVATIRSLPKSNLSLIQPSVRDHFQRLHRCVLANYDFLKAVVLAATGKIFENRDARSNTQQNDQDKNDASPPPSELNMDKLQSTLRQLVRDWTKEGEPERAQCYGPVLAQLRELWPNEEARRHVRVLVPGAGLGRLALEVAKMGFQCQGNEFSLFMLFVSNFVLNHCRRVDQWTVYPYVHQWTNNWSYEDQTRPARLPDADPSEAPGAGGEFSMTAGDFLQVYGGGSADHQDQAWDVVVTVFFLDTAHDPIEYIRTIRRILKPTTGYWINFGPLLYHFADMDDQVSLELPYDQILRVADQLGFELVSERRNIPATYTQNTRSMLQYVYECAFGVFRLRRNSSLSSSSSSSARAADN